MYGLLVHFSAKNSVTKNVQMRRPVHTPTA